MARRIKAADVERFIVDHGHESSEFAAGEWDPGFRVGRAGPRCVHVFYDGHGEADQLDALTTELRAAGYHVVPSQQDRGGRRRLEVTQP
ncbi:hypothetical protein KMT30_05925 [Streptomyces sp. IBSBF 2953]|nr:hypothetical protein [Streptomyces hayashii]